MSNVFYFQGVVSVLRNPEGEGRYSRQLCAIPKGMFLSVLIWNRVLQDNLDWYSNLQMYKREIKTTGFKRGT